MATVHDTLTNGNPHYTDWLTGELIYAESPDSDQRIGSDEPDFSGPTPEEVVEGAEIFAVMNLDNFAPPTQTFVEFLANQARLCAIRENHPWFGWLGEQIEQLAQTAEFVRAQEPSQIEDRVEVMADRPDVREALQSIRNAARLLCIGHWGETAHDLVAAAGEIERALGA